MKQFDNKPSSASNPYRKIVAALLLGCCIAVSNWASATNFTPTTFTDPDYTSVNNATGVITGGAGVGLISLRSALQAADASAGPHTINLLAGTYNVSGGINTGTYIIFGSVNNQNITINGVAGSPLTSIISMTGVGAFQDRIFGINVATLGGTVGVNTTINNVRFTNGHLNSDPYGGGAIEFGSTGSTSALTLSNCEFINNTIDAAAGTTGGAVNYSGCGTLTVTGCTFTNNSNDNSDGGALYYFFNNSPGNQGTMSVSGSTFSGNTATITGPGSGGAIGIAAQGRIAPNNQNFTANILKNTFLNNTAPGAFGGAIIVDNGDAAYTVHINYNRFVNNSSSVAGNSGVGMNSASGSVDATNNWWGCNTDPSIASACNRAGIVGSGGTGTLTSNPWLFLNNTASPNPICPSNPPNSTTVTASFLLNSNNAAVTTANLSTLIGLPLNFNTPVLGTLSAAQTTIQPNGTATVTFTSNGTPGSGSVTATLAPLAENFSKVTTPVITINAAPAISGPGQPVNTSACVGSSASFTIAATGTAVLTYQWYIGATPLVAGAQGSGSTIPSVTLPTLTINNVQPGDAAANYNVVVTNSCGTATSNNVTLTVNTAPAVTANPTNLTVCAPGTATFTAAFSGLPAPTVQWQVSTDGGATYNNIGGATSTTLSFATVFAQNGNKYRCVGTNTCASATTTAATLTVNTTPAVTSNPSNSTVCAPATATFTASFSGSPAPTVQWQLSTDGGATFNNIAGATSTTLSFASAPAQNGNQYRCVATNTCGSATTTAAILTVNGGPVVTSNPSNTSVQVGNTATFTAAFSGTPVPTVQWQVSTNGGATFNNIGGATSTTLSFTTTLAQNGNQYRCVATNTCGSATTTAAVLTVTSGPTSSVLSVSGPSVICNGSSANLIVTITGGTSPFTVVYSNGTSNFTVNNYISGTAITVSPSVTTTYSLVSVTDANLFTGGGNSGTPTITVNQLPILSINPPGPVTICTGSSQLLTASSSCPTYNFSGVLGGNQSVPPNATTATGTFSGTYNSITNQLTLSVTFTGLIGGPASAAHIHSAPAGVNGPVIIPFTGFPAATSGTYTNTFTVPPAEIANFLAGNTYINIHNAVFPGGEIRGQIAAPTPACSPVNSYLWSTGQTTPSITVSSAATYTVTGTDGNGCSGSASVVVNVNPVATVNAVANQVVCNNSSTAAVNFSSPTPGGSIVFNWTNNTPSIGLAASGAGNIASFTTTNATNAPVVATITVTPAYTNGGVTCNGTPITFTITVNPTPTVNAVANQVVCNNSSTATVSFSGSVPGTVYNWTNNTPSIGLAASGAGNIASFIATNATNAPVTATITVTPAYTNGGITCNGTPISFTITVNPTATVNAVANQVVCNNSSTAAVSFSSPTTGGSIVYNWTNNTPSIGLAASGAGNIASFIATNATIAPVTATITVTPSYTNGGVTCNGTPITFTITVNPTATVNAVANQVVCNNSSTAAVNFSSPTTGGSIVYNWTNNTTSIGLAASGAGNIGSFTATNATNAPVVATITVTPAYTNGGITCNGTPISFTITVNPTATVNAVANQVLCNNASTAAVSFSSPTTGGTIVYNWTNNTPSIGLAASGAGNIASFTATNATNAPVVATITVTPAYTNGGITCNGTSITFTITVNPTATVNAVANQVVCNNSSTAAVSFSSPTTGGSIVYNWTNNTPSIGLAASGAGNIASFTATNATNAPVVATITVIPAYTNGGVTCNGTPRTFTITVNPTPTVNTVANQTVCNGTFTAAISFSGAVTGTVFNWTNNTASIGLAASGSGNIAAFTAINNGLTPVTATITVTPSYTNGGVTCTGTPITFTITVNPTPTVTCPANITVNAAAGTCSAIVSFVATATGTPTPIITYSPASGSSFPVGTTTVTVTATNICGTVTCSFTVTVLDVQIPVITTQPANKAVCVGSNATFSVVSTFASSYQWQSWNGTAWINIGTNAASFTVNNVTLSMNTNTFRVLITGPCGTVTTSLPATLTVNALPTISLVLSRPTVLLPGQFLTITAVVSPTGGSFVWFKNGVVISGAISNTLINLSVDDLGLYKVVYTDPNGCVSTSVEILVSAQQSDHLFVYPNPNNGQFHVRFYNQANEPATIRVYDSRGAKVYEQKFVTTTPYSNLDINLNRTIVTNGVYLVEVRNTAGQLLGAKRIIVEQL